MNTEGKAINELIEKAVGSHIRSDMEMVNRAFQNNILKYSWLFEGDILLTQKMLIAACFPEDVSIMGKSEPNEDEDEIYFNMKEIIDRVPDGIKKEVYQRVMEQFVTKLSINELNGKADAE